MKKSLVLFLVVCSVQVVFPVKKKKKGGDFFKSVTKDVSKAVTSTKVGVAATSQWTAQAGKDVKEWEKGAYREASGAIEKLGLDAVKTFNNIKNDLEVCFKSKHNTAMLTAAGLGAAGSAATIALGVKFFGCLISKTLEFSVADITENVTTGEWEVGIFKPIEEIELAHTANLAACATITGVGTAVATSLLVASGAAIGECTMHTLEKFAKQLEEIYEKAKKATKKAK